MKNIHFFEQNLTRIFCFENQLNTLNLKNKYGCLSSRHSIYNFSFLLHLVFLKITQKKRRKQIRLISHFVLQISLENLKSEDANNSSKDTSEKIVSSAGIASVSRTTVIAVVISSAKSLSEIILVFA